MRRSARPDLGSPFWAVVVAESLDARRRLYGDALGPAELAAGPRTPDMMRPAALGVMVNGPSRLAVSVRTRARRRR